MSPDVVISGCSIRFNNKTASAIFQFIRLWRWRRLSLNDLIVRECKFHKRSYLWRRLLLPECCWIEISGRGLSETVNADVYAKPGITASRPIRKRCQCFVFPNKNNRHLFCFLKTSHLILYKIIFCYKAIYILQQTKGLVQWRKDISFFPFWF